MGPYLNPSDAGLCRDLNSNAQIVTDFNFATGQDGLTLASFSPQPVSHYDYALMSLHVYRNKKDLPPVTEVDWTPNGVRFPKGWLKLMDSTVGPKNFFSRLIAGYFGSAYLNTVTGEVVIAHRGTNDFSDLILSDLLLALNKMPEQFSHDAHPFVQNIKTLFQRCENVFGELTNYQFSHTGHSLGAVLAELSGVVEQEPVVVFDSPGTKGLVEEQIAKNPNLFSEAGLNYAKQHTVKYLAAPNVINTLNAHFGTINRLYPPLTTAGSSLLVTPLISFFISLLIQPLGLVSSAIYSLLANFLEKAIPYFLYSLQQHSMSGFYDLFNQPTKSPSQFSSINLIDWPDSLFKGLKLFVAYECHSYFFEKAFIEHPSFSAFNRNSLRKSTQNIENSVCTGTVLNPVIFGDNSDNLFFGSTQSDTELLGGVGDDTYYAFKGNNQIHDAGGTNYFHFHTQNLGTTTIDAQSHQGEIRFSDDLINEWKVVAGVARRFPNSTDTYELNVQYLEKTFIFFNKLITQIYFLHWNALAKILQIVPHDEWQNGVFSNTPRVIITNFNPQQKPFGIDLITDADLPTAIGKANQDNVLTASQSGTDVIGFAGNDYVNIQQVGGNRIFLGGGENVIHYSLPVSSHSLQSITYSNQTRYDRVDDFRC